MERSQESCVLPDNHVPCMRLLVCILLASVMHELRQTWKRSFPCATPVCSQVFVGRLLANELFHLLTW
jgi:hypothetical protein